VCGAAYVAGRVQQNRGHVGMEDISPKARGLTRDSNRKSRSAGMEWAGAKT